MTDDLNRTLSRTQFAARAAMALSAAIVPSRVDSDDLRAAFTPVRAHTKELPTYR